MNRCRGRRSALHVLLLLLGAAVAAPAGAAASAGPPRPATGPGAGGPDDTVEVRPPAVLRPADDALTLPTSGDPDRPLVVLDPRLRERIVAMAERSTRWLAGLLTLRARRFPVLVGTITQLEEELPVLKRFRYDGAAATWIVADGNGRPAGAAVAVNLPMLVIRNRVVGGDGARLDRMVDLHLAHELYGHVVPVAASGNLEDACLADPDPDAPPDVQTSSCVMEREAELLQDLGYRPRRTYRWRYWDRVVEPLGEGEEGSLRRGAGATESSRSRSSWPTPGRGSPPAPTSSGSR